MNQTLLASDEYAPPLLDCAGPKTTHPWWELRPRNCWLLLIGLAALVAWGVIDVYVRGRTDPWHPNVHMTDFTVFTEAGAAFFDGRDPYTVTNPRGWSYLYPPPFAMLLAPLHALDTQWQVMIWFGLSLVMTWGCWRETARLSARLLCGGDCPQWLRFSALAASALPTLNCLQRGQVGIIKLYLLLLGFRLLVESRGWRKAFLAGLVLALPVVLKVTPLVPVGLLLLDQLVLAITQRSRGLHTARASGLWSGTLAGLAVCLVFLPAMLVGWNTNWQHLSTWWQRVGNKASEVGYDEVAGNSYSVRNQSFDNAAKRLGNRLHHLLAGGPEDRQNRTAGEPPRLMDSVWAGRLLLAVRLSVVALALFVSVLAAWRNDGLGRAAAFGLACTATLIAAPIARHHYFMLWFPAAMFVPAWLMREGQQRWAHALAFAPGLFVVTHYGLLPLVGRLGWLGLGSTAWFLASSGLMLQILWRGSRATATGERFIVGPWRVVAQGVVVVEGPRMQPPKVETMAARRIPREPVGDMPPSASADPQPALPGDQRSVVVTTGA